MKSLSTSYLLCALGFFGLSGVHRFYLDKPLSGILYFFTFGLFGVGTILDMVRMSDMVEAANYRQLAQAESMRSFPFASRRKNPEREILRAAVAHKGVLTAQLVALHTSLSLSEALRELEKMRVAGHCAKDVDEAGTEIYTFSGLEPGRPLSFS